MYMIYTILYFAALILLVTSVPHLVYAIWQTWDRHDWLFENRRIRFLHVKRHFLLIPVVYIAVFIIAAINHYPIAL